MRTEKLKPEVASRPEIILLYCVLIDKKLTILFSDTNLPFVKKLTNSSKGI
jgi:hypothetical protein